MKRILFTVLKVLVVAAVALGLLYWRLWAPMTVESHVVERGSLASEVMGTGTLEARTQTMISPKISGRILELTVDEGDQVKAGQTLVSLDAAELEQQVAIAAANVEVAESNIDRLEADQARAAAVVKQATSSHERKLLLASQSAISQEELDQSLEALTVAQAGLGASESAVVQGKKSLLAARELLAYHQARLADTIILAPFDGLVIKKRREVGDVVVPGSNILTLISLDSLWISAWVDETEIAKLRLQQPSRIVFRSEPDRDFLGKVVRIGREADRETREVIVDVELLERPEFWAIGQRAEVYIENGRSDDVLTVPLKYCELAGKKATVYIEQSGVAKLQMVDVTLRARDRVAIGNGVKEGDVILRSVGETKLRDGQKVRHQ